MKEFNHGVFKDGLRLFLKSVGVLSIIGLWLINFVLDLAFAIRQMLGQVGVCKSFEQVSVQPASFLVILRA